MTTRTKLIIGLLALALAALIAGLAGDSSDMNVGGTLAPADGGR